MNANTLAGLHDGATKPDTRAFRYELVADLVIPHIKRRLTQRNIQRHIRTKAELYLGKFYLQSNGKWIHFFIILISVSDPDPFGSGS